MCSGRPSNRCLHARNPPPPASLYRLTSVYMCKSCGQQSRLITPSSCGTEQRMKPRSTALRAAGTDPWQPPLVQQSHTSLRASQPQAGLKLGPASIRKINYMAPFCNTAKDCLPGTVACAEVCSGCATVVLRKGTGSSCQWSHTAAMGVDGSSTAMPAGTWGESRVLGSCEGRLWSCSLDHMGCAV